MNISKQVQKYIQSNKMTKKSFMEKYKFKRTTLYRRLTENSWSELEIEFLKKNGIIE